MISPVKELLWRETNNNCERSLLDDSSSEGNASERIEASCWARQNKFTMMNEKARRRLSKTSCVGKRKIKMNA